MKPYLIDVPVLLIFFTRYEQFSKVIEQVKIAKPSKLYLYQDGPRESNPNDFDGIRKCREIAEDIDWNCEVHRFYQEKNAGCDPSEYIAQKWMFETEEMGIILEDDDVPSQSFFPFCKELLEKYKDDDRINMICGMNNTCVSDHIDASYLFTRKGSIWGWASWRRVLNTWDEKYTWLDDKHKVEELKNAFDDMYEYNTYIKVARTHKETCKAHYESINAASMFFNNRLNIVPKHNMITNIGIAEETTHSVSDIRLLPKRIRKLLYMERYEIEFPLRHPNYIIQDKKFERKMTITKFQSLINQFEGVLLKIYYGDFNGLKKGLKRRLLRKFK
jgi:hypothetical protein